ncbi:MAG: ATP-dependent DNA helicase RecG [Beijerinckiaceae bacterium]|nr:ATP-dependent DNA helicase RecG [Beijerinckiaceae bacterium]
MRPKELDPYFSLVTRLPGIGPKLAPLYDTLLGRNGQPARLLDLALHLPVDLIDRSLSPSIRAMPNEGIVTFEAVVEAHKPPPPARARAPYRVIVGDETGDVTLVFFRLPKAQVEQMLPVGASRVISGRVELFDGIRQIAHPDRILPPDRFSPDSAFEPVYPLTEGLSSKRVQNAALAGLERLPALPEWQDPSLAERFGWPTFREALQALHQPRQPADLDPQSLAYRRLAYDEFLAGQLALQMVRARQRGPRGRALKGDGHLRRRILAALPYALTGAQSRALAEIEADLAEPERMLRLLQGDVGAGKTIVALLAMAMAVEAGAQAAMMAPTEILARQHAERLAPLAESAGIRLALLTGRAGSAERQAVLAGLAAGAIQMVVGTHALFQDDVAFADLGLAIVDEQHRFGVHQRLALARKGEAVDLLVMTATPIPRTLVLGYFGDLDVSVLDEKPPGRKPIDTRLVSQERLAEMVDGIGRAIAGGARVYWVCPLVGESEKLDLAAAEERFEDLDRHFPGKVGLVHGKMPGAARDETIARFARGDLAILVATTVIEVGVDVPEATIMVIEEAQRFGLAQLHQLRGRVGRGGEKSTTILLYRGPLSETARARLDILRQTEDGFRIAEEDLRLRGEGDVLGTRQSGVPGFRIGRLDLHQDLLKMARDDAILALQRDPGLETPRGAALRMLLYLFERDEAIRLMKAG